MYTARDRTANEAWLAEMSRAADALELDSDARSVAEDLFLSELPDTDRSKRAAAAASLYAATLIAGEERSQASVAEAMDVSRLSIQTRWKGLLRGAGFEPPSW